MKIIENFDLAGATTFHIPARAHRFAEYATVYELRQLLDYARAEELAVLHIGAGSNLLFTTDFPGLVIRSAIKSISIQPLNDANNSHRIKAGAGVVWDNLVEQTCELGLSGLENLSHIPGTVGASTVQNVGAYGVEAADAIESVEVYDTLTDSVVTIPNEMLDFGYRHSMFKRPENAGRYVVLNVTFLLAKSHDYVLNYGPLRELANVDGLTPNIIRRRVIEIRSEKLPDPNEIGSAGSFFKNPVVDAELARRLMAEYPTMPTYSAPEGKVKIPAGWLIEQAGLKGATVGGAMVYPKQCLVIVNTGTASGADVVALSDKVRSTVEERFGITISPEVIFI